MGRPDNRASRARRRLLEGSSYKSKIAMSDTEQLFILAGFWTAGALVLASFVPKWPAKIATVVMLVVIPFWELPYGARNFAEVCRLEGGLHVLTPVSPQNIICADYPFDSSAASLARFGFDAVESRASNGEIAIFAGRSQPLKRVETTLRSEYCVTFVNGIQLPWRLLRHDFVVKRVADGVIVARHSVFDWRGMWWQEAASPVLGRGGQCREDPIEPVMAMLRAGSRKE